MGFANYSWKNLLMLWHKKHSMKFSDLSYLETTLILFTTSWYTCTIKLKYAMGTPGSHLWNSVVRRLLSHTSSRVSSFFDVLSFQTALLNKILLPLWLVWHEQIFFKSFPCWYKMTSPYSLPGLHFSQLPNSWKIYKKSDSNPCSYKLSPDALDMCTILCYYGSHK